MRLPSYRFTIRRIMIFTAVVALGMGGELARRRWSVAPPRTRSQSTRQAISLAASTLGPRHWAAAPDVPIRFYDAGRGYWIYAQNYQSTLGGKQIVLSPFAIVWKSRKAPQSKFMTGDLAILDLNAPLNTGKGASFVVRAQLEGQVVLGDTTRVADKSGAPINKPLPFLELDEATFRRMVDTPMSSAPSRAR